MLSDVSEMRFRNNPFKTLNSNNNNRRKDFTDLILHSAGFFLKLLRRYRLLTKQPKLTSAVNTRLSSRYLDYRSNLACVGLLSLVRKCLTIQCGQTLDTLQTFILILSVLAGHLFLTWLFGNQAFVHPSCMTF